MCLGTKSSFDFLIFCSLNIITVISAEDPTQNSLLVSSDKKSQLGTGIYVLLGIWIACLAIFAIAVRFLRARQISLAVLLPLLVLPTIITLILVFYPRFPSKQAELQEYERREASSAAFKAYYYRDIRIALVTICGLAAVAGGAIYLWTSCLETWHPKKLHFKRPVTAKQKSTGHEKSS